MGSNLAWAAKLTCSQASFFPLCPPQLATAPPLFSEAFRPFLPCENALFCRPRGTAQSLERGNFRMCLSTKFGKQSQSPSQNLCENRSVSLSLKEHVGGHGARCDSEAQQIDIFGHGWCGAPGHLYARFDPSSCRTSMQVLSLSSYQTKSTPDTDTFEKYRDTPPISFAILL